MGNTNSKDWQRFIPLSKSWIIRMGFLDILSGQTYINKFLENSENLGGDLLALKRVAETWGTSGAVNVGESGTIYRLFQFASWKLKLNKKFITHATLSERIRHGKITQDPKIVDYNLNQLLDLPEHTTQYGTAAILLGNEEKIPDRLKNDFHLIMSQEAVEYWGRQEKEGRVWEPREDETIQAQAEAFVEMLKGVRPNFYPVQSEDYCFARVFGYMTREEGKKRWPKLQGHETPRLDEMERVIALTNNGKPIDTPDHRAMQAIAMWSIVNKKDLSFVDKNIVNKTWPLFWDFLKEVTK